MSEKLKHPTNKMEWKGEPNTEYSPFITYTKGERYYNSYKYKEAPNGTRVVDWDNPRRVYY